MDDIKRNKPIDKDDELRVRKQIVNTVIAELSNPEKGHLTIEGVAVFLEDTAKILRIHAVRQPINMFVTH